MKVVAITASAFKEQHQKILAAGCDHVMHRPFRTHEIFDAMVEHLGVRFLYEKETEAEQAEQAITPTSEMVAGLPAELRQTLTEAAHNLALPEEQREELRAAALNLSEQDLETALIPVRERDPALADGLAALAQEFRFGRILELLGDKKGAVE